MERASRVCATCKARKKGCDKVLPYCGYCTRRGILCSYEYASPESSKGPERVPSSLASAGSNVSLSSSPFPSSDSACSFSGLENSIQLDIHNIFSTTARAFPEVCDQYFGSFHRWLPIVSQELLLQATATNLDGSPPLDLSLLVLSIYLVTLNPSDENEGPQMSPQKLYVEIRVLLAKLQIMLPASVYLAQATLLVAAYEYACGRPHASYVSIGVCARMLSILRLDRLKSRSQQVNDGSVSDVKSLESQNLYWGIIMLERYAFITFTNFKSLKLIFDRLVANECPSDHLKPSFRIPSPDTELPSDLIPKYFTISPIPNEDFSGEVNPTVGDLQSSKVGSFGRQIQAICFLDQVLEATNEANPAPISILLKLDEKLWGFLAILMDQSSSPRHHCGANGIMVRYVQFKPGRQATN